MPRSISASPGSTWTSDGVGPPGRRAGRRRPCERDLADQGGDHADAGRPAPPRGRAWRPRSVQVGTVSSQSCARRCSRASRITAVWRNPSRPGGRGLVLLDGGEEPGAQLGVPRLDPPGDPARVARRPAGPGSDAGDRRRRGQRERPASSERDRDPASSPGRDQSDGEAPADQGPGQPAERQAAPEPDVPESARDLFQCLPQFACSCRQGLRAGRAGSARAGPPARFRRSGRRSPPGSASARASGGLPAPRSATAGGARGRPPSASGSPAGSRTAPASRRAAAPSCSPPGRGSRRTTAGRRPCRSCRRPAGRSRSKTSAPGASVTAVPSGLWTTSPLSASVAAGSGTRSPTWWLAASSGRGSRPSSRAAISGTNFDDRASWLSAGFQPLARTTSRPLPDGLLDDRRVAVLEPGEDARVAERVRVEPPVLPEVDLGEVVELGAGERGEERVVEGDLAEHHVAADGRLLDVPGGRRPPAPRASRPGPGAATTSSTVPPPRT